MGDIDKRSESFWVGMAGLVVSGISAIVLIGVFQSPQPTFGQVAALILVGFAAFLALMNVLSFAAHVLDISNRAQPFGLPEGSVRAVLTLALIVLVGVLSSFLITRDNRGLVEKSEVQRNISLDAANKFVTDHPGLTAAIKIDDITGAETDQTKKRYNVVISTKTEDKLSEDISKQILTMLSTILAAMIGFYFGAKTDNNPPDSRRERGTGDSAPSDADGAKKGAAIEAKVAALHKNPPSDDAGRQGLAAIERDLTAIKQTLKDANERFAKTGATAADKARADRDRTAQITALDAVSKRLDALGGQPSGPPP